MNTRTILTSILLFILCQIGFSQSNSSASVHQILELEDHIPPRLILKLRTTDFEIVRTASPEIFIKGGVTINVPYKHFLNKMVEEGRYDLAIIPNELRNIELEEKYRAPISIGNKKCSEAVAYTIHVPASVEWIEFHDLNTGKKENIQLNEPYKPSQVSVEVGE